MVFAQYDWLIALALLVYCFCGRLTYRIMDRTVNEDFSSVMSGLFWPVVVPFLVFARSTFALADKVADKIEEKL